ncbi:SMC family ATPase [Olivibacter sp. CPCC 100613]|uniref:SMC family ATPase n=1 Tax=Olivibacter sp. CPCC 100613 TaxID=3079931 RepID=UPI002FF670DB
MIPVSLTIKGLFSYQKEQIINFDRLTDGQLFGIFGSVGSGKSSILEAIAFSLYGETERLSTRDDRNYNMMNLKSDELLIDFVFSNFDEMQYRFVVRGKRHGKKFEKVNTFDRTAYILKSGAWEPLKETTAESLLGLSYENFRRTIIIPQGKFQEFLQLTDKARTDMLKDIFQLDKYEFFQQTTSLERKNNEVMQRLKGRLSVFEHLSEMHLNLALQELETMAAANSTLKTELQDREDSLKQQEELKRLFDNLKVAEDAYNQLQTKATEYQQLKQQLSDYEYCERNFKANIQRAEELIAGIEKRKENLKEYQYKLKNCETLLMEQQQEFANITLKYQSLELLDQKRSDYHTALQMLKLKNDINHLGERIVRGKDFVHKAQQEKIHRDKISIELKEKLKRKKNEKPDLNVLSEIKNWFTSHEHLEKNKKETERAIHEITTTFKEIEKSINSLLNEEEIPLQNYKESLDIRIKSIEAELDTLLNEIAHIQMQAKLGDFVAALHRGEACPLCGALEHPQIIVLADVEKQLQQLTKRLAYIKEEKDRLGKLSRQLEILEVKKATVVRSQEVMTSKSDTDEHALQAHLRKFIWESICSKDDAEVIDQLLAKHKVIEKELEQLDIAINENDALLKKAEADRDQYEEAIKKIVGEEREKVGSLDMLINQLRHISKEEVYTYDYKYLEDSILNIDSEYKIIVDKYEQLQSLVHEQQQLKVSLETRAQAISESMVAEEERLDFINDQLQTSLSKSKYSNLTQVKSLLNLAIAVEEVRGNIDLFFQQLYNVKEQYAALASDAKDKTYDEKLFLKSVDAYELLKNQFNEQQEKHAAAKANYNRLLKQLQEKQQLQNDLQLLQQRADDLSLLKNLFKGSGFVSYISTVYLQQLCDAANKRFYKLTQQRLQLEVTDKNEFQVRDYLNDGKTRLAKTLSGGQTFQASLSLALALAESVQQQNKSKQNFFFLDEGFGSLDKESLAVAFDTLKTLRNEHRIVGVISHVEELQQEIDVYLKIKNDPFLGTQVSGSWEVD